MLDIDKLLRIARELGASEAAVVATADIVVDTSLADRCREPRCTNYGLAKSCPPHVGGPALFRQLLEGYRQAILFKIDVPAELLYSSGSLEVFQLLHEVASGVERAAIELELTSARAYAGGSCKAVFCHEHRECRALSGEECRHPEQARPSMSGFGIDVATLFAAVGWKMNWVGRHPDSTLTKMANVCGLVLLC